MNFLKLMAIIVLSISLISCANMDYSNEELNHAYNYESYENMAELNFESIIDAIETKDSEILKELFSAKALSSMDDYDSAFQNMIDFIDGNIISCEIYKEDTNMVQRGKKKKVSVTNKGQLITDNQKEYLIRVVDSVVDEFDNNDQGVFMVMIASWEYEERFTSLGIQLPQLTNNTAKETP